GVDPPGQVVIRRKLKRRYVLAFFQKLPPCLVGIEACASSHYWARELLHRLGVKVSRNCSVSLPTETINGCLMSCVHVLAHWVLNCSASRSRFWNSIE